MPKKSTLEKRQTIRAKRVLSIQYRLVKPRRKSINLKWQLSTTEDMSLGGIAFLTEDEYKSNDILDIKVVMSGVLDIFDGRGKVVRVTKKRSGSYYLTAVKLTQNTNKIRPAKKYTTPAKV